MDDEQESAPVTAEARRDAIEWPDWFLQPLLFTSSSEIGEQALRAWALVMLRSGEGVMHPDWCAEAPKLVHYVRTGEAPPPAPKMKALKVV